MIDKIIFIASVITSFSTIIASFVGIYKVLKRSEDWQKEKDEHDLENYLSILRLTIMSDEMPITERINAGDKYIKLGGNGAVKRHYKNLLDEYEREVKK